VWVDLLVGLRERDVGDVDGDAGEWVDVRGLVGRWLLGYRHLPGDDERGRKRDRDVQHRLQLHAHGFEGWERIGVGVEFAGGDLVWIDVFRSLRERYKRDAECRRSIRFQVYWVVWRL
jgi:hypothetical protein